MNIIDGYPLILPPCGIKSFLSSYLKALSHHKGQRYVLVVPKFKTFDKYFDTVTYEELSSQTPVPWEIRKVTVPSWMLQILWLISNNPGSFRRYFLFLWEFYLFPRFITSVKAETIFHPYQVISNYQTPARKYVVVHDIFHWVDMDRYNFIQRHYYSLAKTGCQNATKIITISQFSRDQIVKTLSLHKEKVEVCYEGIDDSFFHTEFRQEKIQELKTRYRLPEKFLLSFLSERMYKKNNIAAVQILRALEEAGDNPYRTVFIGGSFETNTTIRQYIADNNLKDKVVFIPKLENRQELMYLYHLADYFVFLSLEEGFGLPPLEAIACGSFPLVSSTSSLEEIYGQTLPTFAPSSPEKAADYIHALSPEKRNGLVLQAKEKLLGRYNWETILPRYLKVMTDQSS